MMYIFHPMGVLMRYCYDYSSGKTTSHPKTVCSRQMLDVKDSTVVASCRFKRFCGQFGNSLLFPHLPGEGC